MAEVAKSLEVSEHTFSRWRNQFGGMKADEAKRTAPACATRTAGSSIWWLTSRWTSRCWRRSPGENSEPGSPTRRRDPSSREVRSLRTSSVSGDWTASDDATSTAATGGGGGALAAALAFVSMRRPGPGTAFEGLARICGQKAGW